MTLVGNAQKILAYAPGANGSATAVMPFGELAPAQSGATAADNVAFDDFFCFQLTKTAGVAAVRMQELGPEAPPFHHLVDPALPAIPYALVLRDYVAAVITAQACETVFGFHGHITPTDKTTLVGVGFRAGADHVWHAFVNDCPTNVAPVTVRRDTVLAGKLSSVFHDLAIVIDGRTKTISWYIDHVLVDSWTPGAALDQMLPAPGPSVMWSMVLPVNGAGQLMMHAGGMPQLWVMNPVALAVVPFFTNRAPVVELPTTFDGSLSTSSTGDTFSWSWGDGSPDTVGIEKVVTHTYHHEGFYDVTLTITGGTTAQVTHTVHVGNTVSTISCRELLSAARARDYRFMNAAMPDGALMLFLNTKQRTLLLQLAPSIEQIVGEILQVASLVGGVLTASDAISPGFPLPIDWVKLIDVKATNINGRSMSIDIIPENEAPSLSAPTRVPTAYISANRIVPVRLGVAGAYSDSWSQVSAVSISYVGMKTVQLLDDFISLPGVLHEALIAGLVVVLSRGVPGITKAERDEYAAESLAADKQTMINAVDMLGDVTERKVNYSR
jgi:PKD repeat protein